MPRRKGCLLWLLKALGVIVLVALAAYTALNIYASARLDREMTTLKAQGAKLTIDEVMPKATPEGNAAPLYQTAFDKRRLSGDDETALSAMLKPPQPTGEPAYPPLPPDTVARARTVVAQNQEALAWVRQAAKIPVCVFPVDWSAGSGVQFPHYAKMRKVARLVGAATVIAALDGKPEAVVQDCTLCLDVGDAPRQDPVITAALVRIAIDNIALRAVDRAMQTATLSPAQCRALASRLGKIEFAKSFERAMDGERAMGLVAFDCFAKQRPALNQVIESDAPDPILRVYVLPANLKLDEAFYLRLMTEQASDVARPWREVGDTMKRLEGEFKTFPGKLCVLTRILVPVFSSVVRKRDTIEAQVGMAQIALGLQACKDETGRYPNNLAELKGMLGWSVPGDPFSGQDFVYKSQGAKYLLYSVGANLRDDGGKTEPKDWSGEKGDIVWGRIPGNA